MEHLYKKYGANEPDAVSDFHLEVKDKEFLVLVGPSGCGKSTTLRMVAGLEDITEGNLYIDNRPVNNVAPKDRDIAMVFQNYALYPHMNVYQNMAFGLTLRKTPKSEIAMRVTSAAKILGIDNLLYRKPKELSGGQRQRVALGRAIVREPKVFLMDEPLSNLDAKLRVQMRTEISKLHQRLQTTLLYVTHDQTEAMTMGDRIAVMKDGVIQQVATPENIYHHPANLFVAGFIGSPSMNFLNGELYEENGSIYFQAPSLRIPLAEKHSNQLKKSQKSQRQVVLGIRPEDIHNAADNDEFTTRYPIGAKLEVAELMGFEMYLYVTVAAQSLVARVEARPELRTGSTVKLLFDTSKFYFFDQTSGDSLL